MKKSLFVLTAALMFGGMASAQTAATASAPQVPALTDVPAGHWAKDAIDRLVSRGIILGYPDGTFRGTQNLTRYEAAVIIARLLEQIRSGDVPAGSLNTEDLTALQNAVQELAADLAALGVRVSDLEENAVSKDDFSRLEARVEELAAAQGDAEAVAKLQAQIDDLTARADEYDTLRADVDDASSSIAALNDLTVLLNQDILDLQDRVSAVEAAQADFVLRSDFDNLSGKVTAIDKRVSTLESAPKFSVSGTVGATYGRIQLVQGSTNFDVDRLTRQTFADNVFSNGKRVCGGWTATNNAVGCTDTDRGYGGDGYLVFGVKASNLSTANGKFLVNSAEVNFYAANSFGDPANGGATVNVDNLSMNGTLNGQKFDVRYEPYRSNFKFNDYLFANDDTVSDFPDTITGKRGIVANIQADQLPLKPKLTVVTGYANPWSDPDKALAGFYYGLRTSVNPANVGTFGVSFAQMDGAGSVSGRSALGADWDLGFGVKNADGDSPFTVKGAYVISVPAAASSFGTGGGTFQNAIAKADQVFYTDVKADLGFIKFGANYRSIDDDYANGVAGMSTNDSTYWTGPCGFRTSQPYCGGQRGFGVGAATNLGPISLNGYFDQYTTYDGTWTVTDGTVRNFGVAGGVKFFGLKALGFYNSATLNGKAITVDGNNYAYNLYTPYMDVADVPFNDSSTYGGILSHDGKASDALIKNLNFTVADQYFYSVKANDLQVYGDYSGTFAGITIAPFARYHVFSAPAGGVNDSLNTTVGGSNRVAQSYNNWKAGVKLSTQPLTGVPFQPSFFGNYVQRASTITGTGTLAVGTQATEMFGQVGMTLNQAIIPNLKASVGYAYYQGMNVASTATGSSASAASATYSAKADRIYASPFSGGATPLGGDNFGSAKGSLSGIFAQADWLGLQANYGVFTYKDIAAGTTNVAQGFKVSYTFKF